MSFDDQAAAAAIGARYVPPLVMMHHATRAVLLAAATVTIRAGLRASIVTMRGSTETGFVRARRTSEVMPTTKQASQIAVSHARDAAEPLLAAARLLKRCEAERGGKLAGGSEPLRFDHRCRKRSGGDDADARDCAEALRQFIRAMPGKQLFLQRHKSHLQIADLPGQAHDDACRQSGHIRCAALGDPGC